MTESTRFELDHEYFGFKEVCGIDEVGRGCLAGPVVVASVVWNPKAAAAADWYHLLADSKKLKEERRLQLYPLILKQALRVRTAVLSPPVIDHLNILRATLHGFELTAPAYSEEHPLLIDGNQRPAGLPWARTVTKGDDRMGAIAAAAVVAKVFRDGLMAGMEQTWPGYGFGVHKGYAVKAHREALDQYGACPQHRKSFRPIKDMTPETSPEDPAVLQALDNFGDNLAGAWLWFQNNYHNFSHHAAHRAMHGFQRAGLSVIPRPGHPPAHQLLA